MFDEHESAKPELIPELAALECQLARITPLPPQLDRDRLMFEAGRASVAMRVDIAEPSRMGHRFWPAATATMTAASVLLAAMLIQQRPVPSLVERTPTMTKVAARNGNIMPEQVSRVGFETTSAVRFSLPQSTTGYLGIRYVALTQGIGALQTPVAAKDAGNTMTDLQNPDRPTARDLMNEFLPASDRNALPRS